MKLAGIVISVAIIAVLVSTCYADQHRIGMILPLTGPAAPFGAVVRRGVDSAGTQTKDILVEDDACDPTASVRAFRSLRQRGTNLFLGPCCTTSMAAVAPMIKRENLLAMNVCTGAERMWDLSAGRVFHAQMSADFESRQNAQMIWSRGIKKVVILYVEQEYALAHEKAFRDAFPGEVVETLSFTGTDIAQVKSLVLKLKSLHFDAIYIPIVEPFFLGVLSEAAKIGARPKNVFSVFSFELPEVLAAEGVNAEGVIYSYPEIPSNTPAAEYFAGVGTKLLLEAADRCRNNVECTRQAITESKRFDEKGFFRGKIGWKTVKNGKFVNLVNE
jgi:ABC-type branched-subunit amino acid transport system substrate-binding protein